MLLALSAKWQGFSGDYGAARQLAIEAIDAASPGSTAAAMSWVVLAFSNGMSGRRSEVLPAMEKAEVALGDCGDGFTFVEGHAILHTIILVGAPDRRAAHREVVHSAARQLDNVIANAIVHRMDVVEQIHGGMVDKALLMLPGAIEAASRAQVTSIEMDLEAMNLLLMAPDDPTLDERALRILTALKAYDYGDTIWGVVELMGTVWAQRGVTDRAATVLGHLQANNRRHPNPFGQPLRIEHLDPVSQVGGVASSLEAGAAMTRNDLINFVIDCLGTDQDA